jgi:hypothetical protein
MEVLSFDADRSRTTLYLHGFNDGAAARGRVHLLTPYLRGGSTTPRKVIGFYSRTLPRGDKSQKALDRG